MFGPKITNTLHDTDTETDSRPVTAQYSGQGELAASAG